MTPLLDRAEVFAALGDPYRLGILDRLGRAPSSATTLAEAGGQITRQAVTKHLRVLERAGLVEARRTGREVLYEVRPRELERSARWLDDVAAGWERRLAAIKDAAES
jgi:DNA-binding transcriptional ArsR family regulator